MATTAISQKLAAASQAVKTNAQAAIGWMGNHKVVVAGVTATAFAVAAIAGSILTGGTAGIIIGAVLGGASLACAGGAAFINCYKNITNERELREALLAIHRAEHPVGILIPARIKRRGELFDQLKVTKDHSVEAVPAQARIEEIDQEAAAHQAKATDEAAQNTQGLVQCHLQCHRDQRSTIQEKVDRANAQFEDTAASLRNLYDPWDSVRETVACINAYRDAETNRPWYMRLFGRHYTPAQFGLQTNATPRDPSLREAKHEKHLEARVIKQRKAQQAQERAKQAQEQAQEQAQAVLNYQPATSRVELVTPTPPPVSVTI